MTTCAIDYCSRGNWFSPGLEGLCFPFSLPAALGLGAANDLTVKPYSVLMAAVDVGAGIGSESQPDIEAVQCCDPVEPICISVTASGQVAASLGFTGYGEADFSVRLGGVAVTGVHPVPVVYPFCCDWANAPLVQATDHTDVSLWVEAVTAGSVTFQFGDFELDDCSCVGVRPVWKSGIAWVGQVCSALYISDPVPVDYGHVTVMQATDVRVSGYQVQWAKACQQQGVTLGVDIALLHWVPLIVRGLSLSSLVTEGWRVRFAESSGSTNASMSASGHVIQWPEVYAGPEAHTDVYPVTNDEDSLRRITVPRFMARSYSPVHTVEISACEQVVFVLNDGCVVGDIVRAWLDDNSAADAVVGNTRDRVTVRAAEAGELLLIKVLRASGQVVDFRVKVS